MGDPWKCAAVWECETEWGNPHLTAQIGVAQHQKYHDLLCPSYPRFLPPFLCLGPYSFVFRQHYMKGMCELWVRTNPSKEISIKTNSCLFPHFYSRDRDAQQNGLPEWICLVINLGVFRSRRAVSHYIRKQATWSSVQRLHLQFHGSFVSRLCSLMTLTPWSFFLKWMLRISQPST